MLAVGMVASSACINSFAEETDRSMIVSCFNERCLVDTTESGVSDDLQEFIEQQKPEYKINDYCAVYDFLYGGVDENGKEIYYPGIPPYDKEALMNKRYDFSYFEGHDVEFYIGVDSTKVNEMLPYIWSGDCISHIVWFDENGKVERVRHGGVEYLEKYDDGTILYKTIDVNTGNEVLMRSILNAFLGIGDDGYANYGLKVEIIQSGDANTDGVVDIVDITTLKQDIVKLIELPDYATISADVDGDGAIDVKDLSLTIKKIIKSDAE